MNIVKKIKVSTADDKNLNAFARILIQLLALGIVGLSLLIVILGGGVVVDDK